MLTVGSLFSGIGGLDLGLERAGMRVLWQCESDPYCRAVLRKHWPDVPCYEDVTTLLADPGRERRGGGVAGAHHGTTGTGTDQDDGAAEYGRPLSIDVLAGGFPCQPFSVVGRRRGLADARWLWPDFARLIRLLRPRYALMENVPGLLVGGGMAEVLGDLAGCGYDAEWDCIPAAALGAPHLRYRVFIVAYPVGDQLRDEQGRERSERPAGLVEERQGAAIPGHDGSQGRMAGADRQSLVWSAKPRRQRNPWAAEPNVGRVADGVPSRVDRLRALGNAVVPQVAEAVGRMIVRSAHNEEARIA
jgi:DNA (cytosine-5)-methyltransferase 1